MTPTAAAEAMREAAAQMAEKLNNVPRNEVLRLATQIRALPLPAAQPDPRAAALEKATVALERIAADHKVYQGYGNYDEGPMSGDECQREARTALAEIKKTRGGAGEAKRLDDWDALNRSISYFAYDGSGVREALIAKRDEIKKARA